MLSGAQMTSAPCDDSVVRHGIRQMSARLDSPHVVDPAVARHALLDSMTEVDLDGRGGLHVFQVVWTGEAAAGGFLTVLDGSTEGATYRLLTADHSVLGGVYRTPREYAGQSIYDIFYLQEAVRCVCSLPAKSRPPHHDPLPCQLP